MSSLTDLQTFAVQQAEAYGIPPSLFLWQIGQESSWNPSAQNGDAFGIAQFMPATAAQYGVDPTNPYSSLKGAAAYDAALYQQYGSYQGMLQHYGTAYTPDTPQSVNDAATNAINQSAATNYFSRTWNGILNSLGLGPGVPTLNADGSVSPADPGNNQRGNIANLGGLPSFSNILSRGTAIFVGLILLAGALYLFGSGKAPIVIKNALKA